ncbi:MAG: hypothetical protein L0387_22010 [Acidobacteria bacterium]|nr:hypothetical protein [Acidobacteriota bacterium]MCI0624285.1 hypothetical protein [Acidobacteriota bacterium]
MRQITPEQMHELAMQVFQKRQDIGFRNAVTNAVLEPANPFQPGAHRRVSRGTSAVLLLAGTALVCFAYFSFLV